jgi:hypothetical protein
MNARPGPRQSRPRWAANYGPERGTTYLIHFSRRYQHAGHYTGWTDKPVLVRFAEHLAGKGAILTRAAVRAGIGLTLARTWPNTTKDREDSLKHQGGARRFCPECGVKPAASRLPSDNPPQRLSLYEIERLGTTSDGTPLPIVTTYPTPATAPDKAAPSEEDQMFGRQKRAAARAEAARQAEADALFAEADRWADLAREPPDFRQQITRERAARIMQQLAEPVAPGNQAEASEPVLSDAERDAEIGRLAELFPEPDASGAGTSPDPLPQTLQPAASRTLAPVAATLPDGTPHADPFLAGRGWQAQGGIYRRAPQAQIEAG